MQLPLRDLNCDPDKSRSMTCAALGSGSGEVFDTDHRGMQVKPSEVAFRSLVVAGRDAPPRLGVGFHERGGHPFASKNHDPAYGCCTRTGRPGSARRINYGSSASGRASCSAANRRAQCGRGAYPGEGPVHRAVPQPVGIIDGVGPRAHRAQQRHHPGRRMRAAAVTGRLDADLGGQSGQADPFGDRGHMDGGMGRLHLGRALSSLRAGSLKNSHHRRSQGSSSFPEKLSTDLTRWIRAECPWPTPHPCSMPPEPR